MQSTVALHTSVRARSCCSTSNYTLTLWGRPIYESIWSACFKASTEISGSGLSPSGSALTAPFVKAVSAFTETAPAASNLQTWLASTQSMVDSCLPGSVTLAPAAKGQPNLSIGQPVIPGNVLPKSQSQIADSWVSVSVVPDEWQGSA